MKTCACSSVARCAFCQLEIREARGMWNWRSEARARTREVGWFSGVVGLDGYVVTAYTGPREVRLSSPRPAGSTVSYLLLEDLDTGRLIPERVK